MANYAAYVICTAPRSGSTLLCRMLAETGVAGDPESLFLRPSLEDWCNRLGVQHSDDVPEVETLRALFNAALTRGQAETGIFALRKQAHSLAFWIEKLRVLSPQSRSDLACIEALFGPTLFVHLSRADKVQQAVSFALAEQTGLWHRAADGSEWERLAPHREPVYDHGRIAELVATSRDHDRQWAEWFSQEEIEPHRITYSVLAADPTAAVRGVLKCLGLDPTHADTVQPGMKKLADATTDAWVARFLEETRSI